jgi:hypothetical protein
MRKEIEVFYFANRQPLFMSRPDSLRKNWQNINSGFLLKGKMKKTDWHSVYHVEARTKQDIDDWEVIRDFVLDRDNYICQACKKHFVAAKLTAHHIISRADGGLDDLDNLITLCEPCHDEVEELGFRSAFEIINCMLPESVSLRKNDYQSHKPIYDWDIHRPEWHPYVYGGKRHTREKQAFYHLENLPS